MICSIGADVFLSPSILLYDLAARTHVIIRMRTNILRGARIVAEIDATSGEQLGVYEVAKNAKILYIRYRSRRMRNK
jgi:hypothetical protein